mmetsp:Transcript_20808/g.60563  ORF Transcript_20808/g.60563 Transcript_20808/m.60563 type:complete len:270 (-) Transcript_20808:258-1067(-)
MDPGESPAKGAVMTRPSAAAAPPKKPRAFPTPAPSVVVSMSLLAACSASKVSISSWILARRSLVAERVDLTADRARTGATTRGAAPRATPRGRALGSASTGAFSFGGALGLGVGLGMLNLGFCTAGLGAAAALAFLTSFSSSPRSTYPLLVLPLLDFFFPLTGSGSGSGTTTGSGTGSGVGGAGAAFFDFAAFLASASAFFAAAFSAAAAFFAAASADLSAGAFFAGAGSGPLRSFDSRSSSDILMAPVGAVVREETKAAFARPATAAS